MTWQLWVYVVAAGVLNPPHVERYGSYAACQDALKASQQVLNMINPPIRDQSQLISYCVPYRKLKDRNDDQ